jgi:hypothetical protein
LYGRYQSQDSKLQIGILDDGASAEEDMSVPDSRGASVVTASPREDGTRMGKSMTAEDRFEREGDIATKLEVSWQDLPKTTASMVSGRAPDTTLHV